ncbi:hypothetical protein EDD16DRAFT_1720906 [Pisolithus croceorrhizus]|nr:hypothetical protein EDD16DRAFT_1720906 [Pisolithus croceorrhizus]
MSARSSIPYIESNLSFLTAKRMHRGASAVEECGDVPNARGGGKGKLNSFTPSSASKATHSKLSPYHKCQSSCPQVTFMQTALAGAVCPHPSMDGGAGKIEDTKKKTARMEFKDMHLPGDILREAVMAQYANCKATRYCILTAMWEIERLERWKHFFDHSLSHLKEKNTTSVLRFKFFKKCCLDLGGDEGHPEERRFLMESTQRDASALGVMQKEFKDAEEVAISLGVFNDSEESHGSYFGVADSSDAEESNWSSSRIPYLSHSAASDPEVPPTSDPEIPYTSDAKVPFPTEDKHGAFVNIGVIRTGTDHEITGRCATRRTLLPSLQPQVSPLSEGVTQAISETKAGQPSASYHTLLPSLHVSTPQQQNEAAAQTISEMEAAQLSQKCIPITTRSSLVTGSFEYMVNQTKDKKIISQVACIVDPVHTLFKNVIREAIQLRVEYLLQDHNFLYTDELPQEFGHCVLTHTLISSVWTMPGAIAKLLDTNDAATINGLVALAGAALGSALYEYCEGRLSTIKFSSNSAGKHYIEITHLIRSMLQNEQQQSLCWSMAVIFFFHADQLLSVNFSIFSIFPLPSLSLSDDLSLLFPFDMAEGVDGISMIVDELASAMAGLSIGTGSFAACLDVEADEAAAVAGVGIAMFDRGCAMVAVHGVISAVSHAGRSRFDVLGSG